MNNNELNQKRLNIEIENILYPLTSLLKQLNKTEEIIIEIKRFKDTHRSLIIGLKAEYIEEYLNNMYSKRNNGDIMIPIKQEIEEER